MTVSALWRRLLVEPARPAAVRDSPRAVWLIVATVCIGAFMGQLDASIVTVAFPTLQEDFGASVAAVEWVALSYLLVLAVAVVAVGRLADMVGRKLLYTYGFAVFGVASVLCGLAPSLPLLDGARAVQALGAALLQANSVALIATAVPAMSLGRAIGVQGAAQALGLALGPTVGGLLLAVGGWRLIFFVNVPAALLGVALGWFLLPRSRDLAPRVRFDWPGLALFAPAVGGLLLALSLGGITRPVVAVVAAVALVGFVLRESRAAAPMLDLTVFRRVAFSAGVSSGLFSYAVLFGVLFVVPFHVERGLGLPVATAGLVLTVLPVALGVVAPLAGRWADRVGPRLPTVVGMLLAAAALGLAAVVTRPLWVVAVELALLGAGLGAFTPANNAAIMASPPREQSGVAGGVLNTTRALGTALGVALAGLVLARGYAAAALLLLALALAAAGLAALRGRPALDRSGPSGAV